MDRCSHLEAKRRMEKVVFGFQARSRISMTFFHFGFSISHAIAGIFDDQINRDHKLLEAFCNGAIWYGEKNVQEREAP